MGFSPSQGGGGNVSLASGAQLDAFARLRVSHPVTLFDSKQIFDNAPLFWDDQEVSGSGTGSTHDVNEAMTRMTVGATTAGKRVRQTFMRFNYQPGKSQLVLMTGVLDGSGGGTGIIRCWGMFDDDNGLFLEDNAGVISFVRRTKTSGSVVDNKTTLPLTFSDGTVIDWSKTQILVFDFEWLGVGQIRFGLVRDGVIDVLHTEDGVNTLDVVYMSTPNLPLRYEIANDGTGAASELCHICATVASEGGQEENGTLRYASTGSTAVAASTGGTLYAVIGIRLKATHLAAVVDQVRISMMNTAAQDFEWVVLLNPTVASTFTYSGETNSAIEVATGATANTVTGGTYLDGSFIKSGSSSGSDAADLHNAIRPGSAIDGTPDEMVVCVRPLANNASIHGSITWRELV